MITKNGKTYLTLTDLAAELQVTPKTVREYIRKKYIPKPQQMEYGLRTISYISREYIEDAKKKLGQLKSKSSK